MALRGLASGVRGLLVRVLACLSPSPRRARTHACTRCAQAQQHADARPHSPLLACRPAPPLHPQAPSTSRQQQGRLRRQRCRRSSEEEQRAMWAPCATWPRSPGPRWLAAVWAWVQQPALSFACAARAEGGAMRPARLHLLPRSPQPQPEQHAALTPSCTPPAAGPACPVVDGAPQNPHARRK